MHISSAKEQVAEHLRAEIFEGRLTGQMPGIHRLASDLKVSRKLVESALTLLENEGLIRSRGVGKRREICEVEHLHSPQLKIRLLLYESLDRHLNFIVELLHKLGQMGNHARLAEKSQADLGFDPKRIQRFINKTDADAWIILSGSYEILELFEKHPKPAFSIFGTFSGLEIAGAGPNHATPLIHCARELISLGHRRIVMIERESRQTNGPGKSEQAFLRELEKHGIETSSYNLPRWKDHPSGFYECLDQLFALTPPTALIIDEAILFHATQHYLARHGLLAPDDISLACINSDPTFAWARPSVAHIHWNASPLVKRVVQWTRDTGLGLSDHKQTFIKARYVSGKTIGPAKTG